MFLVHVDVCGWEGGLGRCYNGAFNRGKGQQNPVEVTRSSSIQRARMGGLGLRTTFISHRGSSIFAE